MASEKRSAIRNKSGLKKNKMSKSGGSIFGCAKGQQEDSTFIDDLEYRLRLKMLENDFLKNQIQKLEDTIKTLVEKMDNSTILKNCKKVVFGDEIVMVEETLDTEKLDLYIETVTKALDSAADDKEVLETTVRRLEETLDSVGKKMNVMELHYSDLDATLTREFKKAADHLMQHRLDIANQLSDLKTIFQRVQDKKIKEIEDEEDERKIEEGINSIKDWLSPISDVTASDVTASSLPIPARKLQKMLTRRYGKIPVELETLLTSRSRGYYESSDTFDNTVARWLVGWIRKSPENTAAVLRRELASLNKLVVIVSDSED